VADEQVFTVSSLTSLIKERLEEGFPALRVEGEISNFRPASSGHLYFSLKDSGAVIQAVMFRGRAASLAFRPADGTFVRVSGALSVYPPRGNYQIICESMELGGEGAILAMLEERKRVFAAEGLFDAERKRPLPRFPDRVAVITSPTGAAIRDILSVLSRRNAAVSIVILPSPVQGAEAAPELAAMIRIANIHAMADVIILSRGGGSLEDLLPFSDEAVVRAVAESRIPVISAVGHEIDFPLSDFAADLRAPTPSAAAELVASESDAALARTLEIRRAIRDSLSSLAYRQRSRLERFSVEELEYAFRNLHQPVLQRFDDAKECLFDSLSALAEAKKIRLKLALSSIDASNPASIMERGYSVVRDAASGELRVSSSEIEVGERLSISFRSGKAIAVAEEIVHEEI
jgi:exodeoxyribonuclease VII large subunit